MKPTREHGTNNAQTYFVTSKTWESRALFQAESWARLFFKTLLSHRGKAFLLHEFVLTPDHFHLLITPLISLERAIQLIKGGFCFHVKDFGSNVEIWQRGFSDHRICDAEHHDKHVRYIHLNPVKKHLSEAPNAYSYPSAYPGWKLDAIPQGLKPGDFGEEHRGTAEAVPFQNRAQKESVALKGHNFRRSINAAIGKVWFVALLSLFSFGCAYAQQKAPAGGPERTRQILIANAHALESRGRPDMAIQIWQQVLLSDPKNTEALAGLARDYKLSGNLTQSEATLEKLRAINPNDPNIAKIQAMASTRAQTDRLRQAGNLARQGHNEDAMRIYRELYGDRPPDGDIALAYYQTLYGTADGKETAIAAMRALAQRNPGDTRYAVALGQMLTYDAKTRAEGIRILKEHQQELNAQAALRQALIWDSANPASAAELREFLKQHPQDIEIEQHLKENEEKLVRMNSGIARTPAERAAFAALNAHRLDDAQARFTALLEKDPTNGRVAAGMGFLRMQQGNFAGAISYFTQAEQNGYKDGTVENALATSRFWYTMGEATQAFNENEMEAAAQKYKEALAMRPRSREALIGLAGLYMKQQQYAEAAASYQALLKVEPQNGEAWRGLFLSYARDGQNDKALPDNESLSAFGEDVKHEGPRIPAHAGYHLSRAEPRGRRAAGPGSGAGAAVPQQRDQSQSRHQASIRGHPDGGQPLRPGGRDVHADPERRCGQPLGVDGAGERASRTGPRQRCHRRRGKDAARHLRRVAERCRVPGNCWARFTSRPTSSTLRKTCWSARPSCRWPAGGQPSIQLQLQLAAIYLQRNNTDQAYNIYRQVLTAHPERADAWKGLINTLQVTNHTNEALQQIAVIPPDVRKQLEGDPEFVETEASLYATAGDTAHAMEYMNRVLAHYAQLKQPLPPNLDIQNAWLLYNTKNDRALYPWLMRLGGRADLTAAQRETVQTIWANWSVRRAAAALENNDSQRAVDILEAAARAFPDNMTVRKVLAGGYLRTGQVKEALAIYKSVGMQDASAADFQGAIGAALAANDKTQAEIWLRQGLERFPNDPAVLAMAARFEQARGDNQRAADYWRASIAAMPATSPTDKLAHELAYPEVSNQPHKARTTAQLQDLLNPDNEPFPRTTKLPPLPAYGPDPYNGRPPVILTPQQPAAQQQQPVVTAPATTTIPVETAPATRSTSTPLPVPMARAPDNPQPNAQPAANPAVTGQPKHSTSHPPSSYSGKGQSAPVGRKCHIDGAVEAKPSATTANSGFHSSSAFGNQPRSANPGAAATAIIHNHSGFGRVPSAAHNLPADESQGGPGAGAVCRPDRRAVDAGLRIADPLAGQRAGNVAVGFRASRAGSEWTNTAGKERCV